MSCQRYRDADVREADRKAAVVEVGRDDPDQIDQPHREDEPAQTRQRLRTFASDPSTGAGRTGIANWPKTSSRQTYCQPPRTLEEDRESPRADCRPR